MLISPAGPLFVQRQLIISAPVRRVWMQRQGVWALVRRWDLTTMCFQRCGGERLTAIVGFNTGLRRRQALHSIRMPENNTLTAHSAENPRAGEEHSDVGAGRVFCSSFYHSLTFESKSHDHVMSVLDMFDRPLNVTYWRPHPLWLHAALL